MSGPLRTVGRPLLVLSLLGLGASYALAQATSPAPTSKAPKAVVPNTASKPAPVPAMTAPRAAPTVQPTSSATPAKVLTPGRQVATSALPAAILGRANEHLADGGKDLSEWRGAALATTAQLLYRPDLAEVAYYHVAVTQGSTAAGYIILSAGEHDMPVVEWSERGTSPIAELDLGAVRLRRVPAKYYMLDLLSFAAEDSAGELIVSLGELPSRELRQKASTSGPTASMTWKARKAAYASTFDSTLKLARAESAQSWQHEAKASQKSLLSFSCDAWDYHYAGKSDQRWYHQVPANQAPNTSGCASGCGATAWAMLFGWADYKAAKNASPWQYSKGIYREYGGKGNDVEAPALMDLGVSNMSWELRGYLKTTCVPGEQGLTLPTDMDKARQYLAGRASGARVQVNFSSTGGVIPSFEFRDQADASIRDGRPVILLLGVEHYALAYGYRKKKCTGFDEHEFKINEGQGPGGERWTSANTWFVGQLHPAPNPNPPPASSNPCPTGKRCCEPLRDGRCSHCRPNSQACP